MTKLSKAEARVVNAALALCNAGSGFCFNDKLIISDINIGKRLENACAALQRQRERRKRR